ncbi:hypothetical protein [Paenibacillus sp. TY11]|uniref:hypothetical protein n=1 Tax=Paenibacillus sp. TY11 TaxID=3448633 RepID=UPI004039A422
MTSSTYSESANQPEGVVPPVINGTDPSLNGDVTTQGKVSWTIKGIKAALKSQASKIDNVIKTTIDWLPVSDSVKKNLINVVKVDALIKALDVATVFAALWLTKFLPNPWRIPAIIVVALIGMFIFRKNK